MGKFKRLVLTELGETTESYDFRLSGSYEGEATYNFKTENHNYVVKAMRYDEYYIEIGFETERSGSTVTNEGNQFKVISTVLDIAQDAWNRREEIFYGRFQDDDPLKGFVFSGVYKRDEPYTKDQSARDKLYKTFIKKQFPGAKIDDDVVTKVRIK